MTDSMNCTSAQEMFSALADGELDAADVVRIESHIATCSHCAQEWHLFRESLAWLHEVQPVHAPSDLLVGIHAKLAHKNPITTWLRDLFGSPLSALSSMAIITLALFFWVANDTPTQTPQGTMADAGAFSQNRPPATMPTRLPARQRQVTPTFNLASDSWSNNLSSTTARLSAIPGLTPDYSITVHAPSPETQDLLYQRILSQNHWRVHPARNGTLLIYLDEQDLSHLQHTLGPHRLTMTPQPSLNKRNGALRAVSLRVETQ
ncbi:MAG: zf-HC2 domain-containing protein [Desulfobulbaceae bacterium]|nr:zf-HC2 domain-containing protein [Desulfobulbaceae bacterium]